MTKQARQNHNAKWRKAMRRRIYASYKAASRKERANGMQWYTNARSAAFVLSLPYGDTKQSAGIIAALSPGVSWEQNTKDAWNLVRVSRQSLVGTYGANKAKALRILDGESAAEVLGGNKVRAFWVNICGDLEPVTIDRHAWRVANGEGEGKVPGTDNKYRECARAYQEAAKHLGLKPAQLQAICWLEYKGRDS